MPVAELSLNELSRRVGLAKSNVLRYFESREMSSRKSTDGLGVTDSRVARRPTGAPVNDIPP